MDPPGAADLRIGTNAITEEFGALAVTLEMPFKDNADRPDEEHGWSPERCASLGASAVDAIAAALPLLDAS